MKNIFEYAEGIKKELSDRYPELIFEVKTVVKNNGVKLTGIFIRETVGFATIAPSIYIDDIFDEGRSVYEACDFIMNIYAQNKDTAKLFNIDDITGIFIKKDEFLSRVKPKLVWGNNIGDEFPYKRWIDLLVRYYIPVGNNGSIGVTNNHIEALDISPEELFDAAVENLRPEIRSLHDVVSAITGEDVGDFGITMLVLKEAETDSLSFGASAILKYKEILKNYGDLYLLPSSIYEWIMIPAEHVDSGLELQNIVREVNRTVLMNTDVLSNNLYYYDSVSRKIQLALWKEVIET